LYKTFPPHVTVSSQEINDEHTKSNHTHLFSMPPQAIVFLLRSLCQQRYITGTAIYHKGVCCCHSSSAYMSCVDKHNLLQWFLIFFT